MKIEFSFNKKQVAAAPANKRVSDKLVAPSVDRVKMAMDTLKDAVDSALDHQTCNRADLLRIYDNTRKDGHVKSQYKVAVNKVLSEPWIVLINDTENEEKKKLLAKTWFDVFVKNVVDVEFYGYTLVEFGMPDDKKGWTYVKTFPRLHVNPFKKMILFQVGGNEGIEYADIAEKLFLLELGDPEELGEFESVSREVIWKNFSRSDWSEYNERFGKPLLDIACNTDDDEEVANKIAMAKNFGTNAYIVRDIDDQVQMISPTGSANGSQFLPLAEFCNAEISKIMNGQTGTSDEKSFVGAAEVHERVLDDFTKGRLRNVQSVVNDKLIPFLIGKGWPLQGCLLNYPILTEESNTEKTEEEPDMLDPEAKGKPIANQLKKKGFQYPW